MGQQENVHLVSAELQALRQVVAEIESELSEAYVILGNEHPTARRLRACLLDGLTCINRAEAILLTVSGGEED